MEALSDVDGEDDVFYDCDDLDGLLGLNAVDNMSDVQRYCKTSPESATLFHYRILE